MKRGDIISLKIDLKIFLFALIFYFTKQIDLYASMMIFAFLHEIGHLIAGLVCGLKPKNINVMPIGFSISFKLNTDDYNMKLCKGSILSLKKIIIAIAGPIVNVVLAALLLSYNIEILGIDSETLVYANIIIAMFNLLPIYPLDGGRIVRNILEIFINRINSIKYTNLISNVTVCLITAIASIGVLYFKNIAIILVIVYIWMISYRENRYYKVKSKIYNITYNLES